MKTNANHIGFAVASTGITCTTLGHYAEFWIIGYGAAIIFGLICAAIFEE